MKKYYYTVVRGDNFHVGDPEHPTGIGESFKTCAEARAACEKIVRETLSGPFEGLSIEERTGMYQGYVTFGDSAYIVTNDRSCRFSSSDYAKMICGIN